MDSLVHQFGLFEFKTGKNSLPSTPTHRSKASIFGLDAISRNLFNSRPGSSMGDFFSGSINGHRRNRSRSTTSRSSTYTQTTTTVDSMKSSHRSNSTATAATTMSTMDDDISFFSSRSSKGKKLSKRSRSLVDATYESEHGSFSDLSRSQPQSRSSSRGPDPDYSDVEDDSNTIYAKSKEIGTSDYNLAVQLELARQNSLNQHGKRVTPMQLDAPVQATIYEGGMRPYHPEMIILTCPQRSHPILCVLHPKHLAKYLFVLQLHDLHHPRRLKTPHPFSQELYCPIHMNDVP
jgi:hypothetical protein